MSLPLLLYYFGLLRLQITNLSLGLRPSNQRLELDARVPLDIFDQIDLPCFMSAPGRLEADERPSRVLPFSFFARDGIFAGLLLGLLPTDHGRDAQGLLELPTSLRFCSR